METMLNTVIIGTQEYKKLLASEYTLEIIRDRIVDEISPDYDFTFVREFAKAVGVDYDAIKANKKAIKEAQNEN